MKPEKKIKQHPICTEFEMDILLLNCHAAILAAALLGLQPT